MEDHSLFISLVEQMIPCSLCYSEANIDSEDGRDVGDPHVLGQVDLLLLPQEDVYVDVH